MDERLPGIRPRPGLGRRLDMSARRGFPMASTVLLMLFSAAPLGLPGQAELLVSVTLSCVFFWSLFRPASMPPPAVFMLGVLLDLLGFGPPGVGVLTLLVLHGFALRWRGVLVRQGFLLVWLAFAALSCGAALVEWALSSLLLFRLLPPAPGVFQAALAAGVYPPLAMLLIGAHQTLADPRRS
jgi:rod shape-determining protein MreD